MERTKQFNWAILELATLSGLLLYCLVLKILLANAILLPQEAAWDNLPGLMQNYFYAAFQFLEMPVFELPFSPVTWMTMALVIKIFGLKNSIYTVGLFLGLLTTLTFLAFYFVVRKSFGVQIALITIAIIATSDILNYLGITASKHVISTFFLSLALLVYAYMKGMPKSILVGAMCGLSFASFEFNLIYGLFFLCIYLFFDKKKIKHMAFFTLGFIVAISPFIVRNYTINGRPWDIPWSDEWVGKNVWSAHGLEESYIAKGYHPRTAHLFFYSAKKKEII